MTDGEKPRLLDAVIAKKLKAIGGIVLRGPRGVGKTTTALHFAKSSVRLDKSMQLLEQARLAPETLLEGETPRLFDEWQLAPNLWNVIRAEIDSRGQPGQFILSGSVAPADDQTRHTGAMRYSRITMRPMSLFESGDSAAKVDVGDLFKPNRKIGAMGGLKIVDYPDKIVRGGWPLLVDREAIAAQDVLIDYVDNIASVDLRTLKNPPDPERMSALIRAVARNISTEATLETLSRESDLFDSTPTAPTVRKYLDQLSEIFVLDELPAWKTHIRSSIQVRQKPKWHFVDPSLATAALGISPDAIFGDFRTYGLFFESLAVRDMRVYADILGAKVYYYKDSAGLEIDMIIERRDGKFIAVEVKLGGEDRIAEAVENFAKFKGRLSDSKLGNLVSCSIITAEGNSYTREDGVNIISLGHLYAKTSRGALA
jgi:predicted AAA+ superfamily ATPase